MKWKCLIVDDEPPAVKIIKNYAEMVDQLEVIGSCSNVLQAMEYLKSSKVDLLFLDIQMPKLLGTSFLETLLHPPKVIFITAYKEYATVAFDLDAVDYLLKPVSFVRFLKAVNKVTSSNSAVNITGTPSMRGFLYFRSERKMIKVFLSDILYVESLKDYIRIYRLNDNFLQVKLSISAVEAMLPKNMFVRIHRSFVVSLDKITAYTNYDVEIGTKEIPIGRQYLGALKALR
jgi:DNA-binding LytR/AlgR family response regulator